MFPGSGMKPIRHAPWHVPVAAIFAGPLMRKALDIVISVLCTLALVVIGLRMARAVHSERHEEIDPAAAHMR